MQSTGESSPARDEDPASPSPVEPAAASEQQPVSASADSDTPNGAPESSASSASDQDSKPQVPPGPTPTREEPPPRVLLITVLSILVIGLVLWVVFSATGYREQYSASHDGWRVGGKQMIEITLVKQDKENLACASEKTFQGLRCAYDGAKRPWPSGTVEPRSVLSPYNTIKNELFMAAGLWQNPVLAGSLPVNRFTVVCNYEIVAVSRNAGLRWSPKGNFEPQKNTVPVGRLTDCMIPQ
jgi:hypothetical protein